MHDFLPAVSRRRLDSPWLRRTHRLGEDTAIAALAVALVAAGRPGQTNDKIAPTGSETQVGVVADADVPRPSRVTDLPCCLLSIFRRFAVFMTSDSVLVPSSKTKS